MKKSYIFLLLLVSIVVSMVSYIAVENLYLTIGVFVIYLIFAFAIFLPILKKSDSVVKNFKDCSEFIYKFISVLSVKGSLSNALDAASSVEIGEQINSLQNMDEIEKLKYLSSIFPFYEYLAFLEIITIWSRDGGDILNMSDSLLEQLRNSEDQITQYKDIARKKYFEFSILWTLCLAILVFIRFCLKDFYIKLKNQVFYIVFVGVLALLILLSTLILIKKGTGLEIKRYQANEKNI